MFAPHPNPLPINLPSSLITDVKLIAGKFMGRGDTIKLPLTYRTNTMALVKAFDIIAISALSVGLLAAEGESLKPDLSATAAGQQWLFTDKNGKLENSELIFDGRQQQTAGFFLPHEFADVTITAKFLVEPQAEGVLACGFIFRAMDGSNYYYVHFDRAQAILVRHSTDSGWNEIKRVSGLDKPAGKWHEGRVECLGPTIRVSLNGKLLYEANDSRLARGRIGFYGSQGLVHVKDIAVEGKPLQPESELTFPPPNYITVCEDAGAGAYEAFPDVCRLADGRLMCVFYAGYGHVALPNEKLPKGGRISFCLSHDEGRTWSAAQPLVDTPDDDRDPSIVQLKNGQLMCNFFSLRAKSDAKEKEKPPWEGLGTWIVTSDDAGRTWSTPRQISKSYYCSSPIRELSNGRLILGLYKEADNSAQGAVIFSDDGGKSWQPEVDIDNGGFRLDAETDLIELKDGSLYAVLRAQACFSKSNDRGGMWTVSQPIGFAAHCPYFLRTPGDVILLAHRLPNTSLHYSTDECRTWSSNVAVDEVIGAYPSMVNLRDGSVLIVYYEEGPASNIRAKRFRTTRQGIEWLK